MIFHQSFISHIITTGDAQTPEFINAKLAPLNHFMEGVELLVLFFRYESIKIAEDKQLYSFLK